MLRISMVHRATMRRHLRLVAAVVSLAEAAPASSAAQSIVRTRSAEWVGSPLDDYVRLMQLTGAAPLSSRLVRPLEYDIRGRALSDTGAIWRNPWRGGHGTRQRSDTSRATIEIYDPILRTTENTAVPFGGNDGLMWAGKGASAAVDIGAAFRSGPFTLRLAPSITYSQNAAFALGPLLNEPPRDMSIYGDPYISRRIDMPQRFGDKAIGDADWGQSSAQLNTHGVRVGVSTENMWWGPGIDNALLMTNNAPGFPHTVVGTEHPINIFIGKLEALHMMGLLRQSAYWRKAVPPDSTARRWVNSLVLVLEPHGVPGLYLGAGRLYYAYVPKGGISLSEVATIAQPFSKNKLVTAENPFGDDRRDQMLTMFGRWVFPAAQAEVYGEYGRNDHAWDDRDLTLEPDHSRAYVIGIQKLIPQDEGFVRVRAEATSLASTMTQRVRRSPYWYAHFFVSQGYTERGQVIGAPVGPGGDAQNASIDVYRRWGSVGGFVQRQRENSDAYYQLFDNPVGTNLEYAHHDVFMGWGLRGTLRTSHADVTASVLKQTEYNRYTQLRNDVHNLHAELGVQLLLPR